MLAKTLGGKGFFLLFLEDLPQKAVVPLVIPAAVKVSALQVPSKI